MRFGVMGKDRSVNSHLRVTRPAIIAVCGAVDTDERPNVWCRRSAESVGGRPHDLDERGRQ